VFNLAESANKKTYVVPIEEVSTVSDMRVLYNCHSTGGDFRILQGR